MRRLLTVVVTVLVSVPAAGDEPRTLAVYWAPPDAAPGERARAAFAAALLPRHLEPLDAGEPAPEPVRLAPQVVAAVADYAGFRFADAAAKLDEVARLAAANGGADLDERQLADVFLYRGMALYELGRAEAAWDDLARAARLEPGRVLDSARFPPRVVAAWRRAAVEAAALPRAELEVRAPADAVVRVDGRPAAGAITVSLGAHFVSIEAPGFERWAGVVSATGARERVEPPLRARQPPGVERLMALARERGAGRVLLGAVVRAGDGWRFVVREVALPDGRALSDSVALGDAPADRAVAGAVTRMLEPHPPEIVRPAPAPPPPPSPPRRRWWIWIAAGGAAAALAVAIPLGVVYSRPPPASAGGALGPLR